MAGNGRGGIGKSQGKARVSEAAVVRVAEASHPRGGLSATLVAGQPAKSNSNSCSSGPASVNSRSANSRGAAAAVAGGDCRAGENKQQGGKPRIKLGFHEMLSYGHKPWDDDYRENKVALEKAFNDAAADDDDDYY